MSDGQIVSSFLAGTYHAECSSCGWHGEEHRQSLDAEFELTDHICAPVLLDVPANKDTDE